jgi:hypothetical protein
MPVIPSRSESIKEEDCDPGWPGKNQNPISKIITAKRDGIMVIAIEYLPDKCKVQSSSPNTSRERERKRGKNVPTNMYNLYVSIGIFK